MDVVETLTEVRRLRDRSRRRAHGGAWLPGAILAALVLLSAVLYRFPFTEPNEMIAAYPYWAGLPDWQRSTAASYAFWLVGLPLAFAAIAAWYRYRARRTGVRVAWPVLVGAGLGALVLLLVLVAVPRELPADPDQLSIARPPYWHGLATPLMAVAIAILALGWVERSPFLGFAGLWFGGYAWYQCATGMLGALPVWLVRLMDPQALGGALGMRPFAMLVALLLPLLGWTIVKAVRGR